MSNITTTQLSAYLDGDLSDSESTNIERELQSSEDLQRELESLRRAREWVRNYPGREPSESVWENFLGETLGAEHEPDAGRGTVVRRGPFAWLAGLRWQAGPALARAWVAVLITLAVGGMGRSVFLQMRTNELSEANAARDAELVRIFSNANWLASAGHLRGHNGQSYSLMCPAYGRAGTVWGTGVYTDDSSVCTAAVHAGIIDFRDGGLVSIQVGPGQAEYDGSAQSGVQSRSFGKWDGSFSFLFDFDSSIQLNTRGQFISWGMSATDLRGEVGQRMDYMCAAGGEPHTVWGTEIYTDDSSICTAAVHMGLIDFVDGGSVTIEMLPGQPRYQSSSAYDISSRAYGSWQGSFRFIDGGTPFVSDVEEVDPEWIDWDDDVSDMRDWNGFRTSFRCPALGTAGAIWGTDTYSDDSSICTAAVHAGVITFEDGGTVTIEIMPGLSAFESTVQRGVESRAFGSYPGSFRFVDSP